MQQFLIRSLLFLALAIGVIAGVGTAIDSYIVRKASFKCKDGIHFVVLGNSHPEQAYNDSLIDHFQNLSQAAETYFYTYLKTRQLVEQNPRLDTFFIEFSNTDLLVDWNRFIWGSRVLFWRYPLYAPFMDFSEERVLMENNLSGLNGCLPVSLKDNLGRIIHHDLDYTGKIGGFVYNPRAKVDSFLAQKDLRQQFEARRLDQNTVCECNVLYLQKLMHYLADHGKKVYLIRSPLHPSYPGLGNEAKYQEILHGFGNIDYLDFKDFPLDNEDYVDLEHLNSRGGRIFSIWFNALIRQGLLQKVNKQQLIDENIKQIASMKRPL